MNQSSNNYFKNEDDRNDFFISIPVIAIAGAFILWQWGSNTDLKQVDTITLSPIESTIEISEDNTSAVYTTPIEDILKDESKAKTNTAETRNIRRPKREKKEVEEFIPTSAKTIADSNELEIEQIIENTTDQAQEIKDEEISESTSAPVESETSQHTANEVEETPISATTDELVLDCSIAVGLYKEDANLHKMHNRLIDNDYNAIIVPLRNSSKVAVRIPCNKESSQRILQEIRSNFAADAFIE